MLLLLLVDTQASNFQALIIGTHTYVSALRKSAVEFFFPNTRDLGDDLMTAISLRASRFFAVEMLNLQIGIFRNLYQRSSSFICHKK